ncbi:MAG: hypothetical protein WDW36_003423 [Sanguina aurantia]
MSAMCRAFNARRSAIDAVSSAAAAASGAEAAATATPAEGPAQLAHGDRQDTPITPLHAICHAQARRSWHTGIGSIPPSPRCTPSAMPRPDEAGTRGSTGYPHHPAARHLPCPGPTKLAHGDRQHTPITPLHAICHAQARRSWHTGIDSIPPSPRCTPSAIPRPGAAGTRGSTAYPHHPAARHLPCPGPAQLAHGDRQHTPITPLHAICHAQARRSWHTGIDSIPPSPRCTPSAMPRPGAAGTRGSAAYPHHPAARHLPCPGPAQLAHGDRQHTPITPLHAICHTQARRSWHTGIDSIPPSPRCTPSAIPRPGAAGTRGSTAYPHHPAARHLPYPGPAQLAHGDRQHTPITPLHAICHTQARRSWHTGIDSIPPSPRCTPSAMPRPGAAGTRGSTAYPHHPAARHLPYPGPAQLAHGDRQHTPITPLHAICHTQARRSWHTGIDSIPPSPRCTPSAMPRPGAAGTRGSTAYPHHPAARHLPRPGPAQLAHFTRPPKLVKRSWARLREGQNPPTKAIRVMHACCLPAANAAVCTAQAAS